jgi:RNA polymerase sigma-70 factor (ECF subfamily)
MSQRQTYPPVQLRCSSSRLGWNKTEPVGVLGIVTHELITTATDEGRLVDRLRAGDESAVADLESRYGARIYQLAFRYMKNREDAEEVAQDVLLKVYSKIGAFRGDSALSSWIYRITFNAAMSRLRAIKAARATEIDDRVASIASAEHGERGGRRAEVADWSSMADDEMLRGQLRRKLAHALLDMPPIYRVPVLLRDVHGLTTEEASAVLRVKDETLKSRLHRGRLILRDRLADFADGLSLHRPPSYPAVRGSAALLAAS